MITQQQAENMVYEHLRLEYTKEEIIHMPYIVKVSGKTVTVIGICKQWYDVYEVVMMPQLMKIA